MQEKKEPNPFLHFCSDARTDIAIFVLSRGCLNTVETRGSVPLFPLHGNGLLKPVGVREEVGSCTGLPQTVMGALRPPGSLPSSSQPSASSLDVPWPGRRSGGQRPEDHHGPGKGPPCPA